MHLYTDFSFYICPFCLYLSLHLSLPLFTHSFLSFLGALTCRGPLAGMVDLSDVRSMSRPCSPLSVFPSPCIIRPEASKQTKHSHTRTLQCYPHSSENANARMAVVVMKGNDPGRQAPSTRQRPGRTAEGQTNGLFTPLPPSLSLTLTTLSLSPTILPPVPNLVCKNV